MLTMSDIKAVYLRRLISDSFKTSCWERSPPRAATLLAVDDFADMIRSFFFGVLSPIPVKLLVFDQMKSSTDLDIPALGFWPPCHKVSTLPGVFLSMATTTARDWERIISWYKSLSKFRKLYLNYRVNESVLVFGKCKLMYLEIGDSRQVRLFWEEIAQTLCPRSPAGWQVERKDLESLAKRPLEVDVREPIENLRQPKWRMERSRLEKTKFHFRF